MLPSKSNAAGATPFRGSVRSTWQPNVIPGNTPVVPEQPVAQPVTETKNEATPPPTK